MDLHLRVVTAVALLVLVPAPATLQAQSDPRANDREVDVRRALPFAEGEHHEFEVRFGRIPAGKAQLTVAGAERLRGIDVLRFDFRVEGGALFARVDNRMSSWSEVRPFRTLRFEQELDEVGTERYRNFEIFPSEKVVRWTHGEGGEEPLPSDLPLDDVSFLYYVRTLPLEVGDRYVMPHYFRESGNPVVIEVLRKDEVSVPAGRYRTIVVRPTFQSSGLFAEGGEAEVHFSDDRSRVVVKVSSRISRIGSLHLNLVRDPRRP